MNIQAVHYQQAHQFLVKAYRDELGLDLMDTRFAIYTYEEQVDRYAAQLAFWSRHGGSADTSDPFEFAKAFIAGDMRVKILKKVNDMGIGHAVQKKLKEMFQPVSVATCA